MNYIQGKTRTQIVLIDSSIEERIEQDNPVRIIDAFVNSCNLEEFGFTLQGMLLNYCFNRRSCQNGI